MEDVGMVGGRCPECGARGGSDVEEFECGVCGWRSWEDGDGLGGATVPIETGVPMETGEDIGCDDG